MAKLWERVEELELVNDGALAAQTIWISIKRTVGAMWQSRHGIYLIECGFGSICHCAVCLIPIRWRRSCAMAAWSPRLISPNAYQFEVAEATDFCVHSQRHLGHWRQQVV